MNARTVQYSLKATSPALLRYRLCTSAAGLGATAYLRWADANTAPGQSYDLWGPVWDVVIVQFIVISTSEPLRVRLWFLRTSLRQASTASSTHFRVLRGSYRGSKGSYLSSTCPQAVGHRLPMTIRSCSQSSRSVSSTTTRLHTICEIGSDSCPPSQGTVGTRMLARNWRTSSIISWVGNTT